MAKNKSEIDAALDAAASAFKRTAEAEVNRIKSEMQDVLQVKYAGAPKAAIPSDLPAPRLQLRWSRDGRYQYELTCYYEMIIPLIEHDCRNDAKQGFAVVELSRTSVGGGSDDRFNSTDVWMLTPFRDGSHIQWDCEAFGGNLPMYVITPDGKAHALPKREKCDAA